jgi:UDP:flavonoid glycosyltransferase YjiC (YdhE family)
VRVLFTCVAADGHFRPLVPLARAFRDRGDDVAVATAASFRAVADEGLPHLQAGIDQDELNRQFAALREEIFSLPIPERRPYLFSGRFAQIDSPARLDDLFAVADDFRPDLLVHESAELAGPVVAAKLGVASVQHSFGRAIPMSAVERAATIAAPMWERAGLEPAPFAGMYRGPFVDIAPPSLEPERPPAGTVVLPLRAIDRQRAERSGRPLVYVTLGTVVGDVAVFQLLLDALADLHADVLLTIGRRHDPENLAAPANATIERFVPQAEILPRASLVVTHGGSGSMLGALAHGVPMVIVPRAADQFDNADAAAAAGTARVVMPDDLTEAAVRSAAGEVLGRSSYRDAAESVAGEIAAMPSAAEVAERLSAL